MANSRLNLHEELCTILGSRNVYYNPPESVKMNYPCFRYTKAKPNTKRADNKRYAIFDHYIVTIISKDPDNDFAELIADHFDYVEYDSHYNSDNLSHDVVSIYYHKED